VAGEKIGIIFDLDGTLLDTLDDISAACNRGLAACGFPPRTRDEYRRFVGGGIETLVRRALPASFQDEAGFPEILGSVAREYAAVAIDKTVPYPGIVELLDELSHRRISMAVVSNKPHDLTVECVRRLLSRFSFTAVIGARPTGPRKPDPADCLEIAAQMGLPPTEIFLVGDSEVDLATAVNAGMKGVAVTWGFRPREELERLSPFALVDRPAEILDLLSL
jgi:phosphoglycolate phosphatase